LMGLSCILLCVVFSEQYFAHIQLWYVWLWQYVVCVVHRVDAACVVPTVIIVTVDSCMGLGLCNNRRNSI
jgi:hypothetical protein